MAEVILTQQQIERLQTYVNNYDTHGGWSYLASLGDRYADNAAAITSKNPNDLHGMNLWMKKGVENLWDKTAGKEVREAKFDQVAYEHFTNYVKFWRQAAILFQLNPDSGCLKIDA